MAIVLFTAGCSGTVDSSEQAPAAKPRQGTTLRVSCPDDRLRTLIEPMVRVWAHETGAAATVTADRMTPGDATDVAILPNAELGLWADRGELVQVPFQFREPGNAYVWSGVLQPYRNESAAGWGGQLFGLPVAAETSLIVYRADRFADPAAQADYRKRSGKTLAAPTTWEAFADIAAFFAERDKKPSLPRLDATRLEELFLRVAACYDRPAITGDIADNAASIAFAFELTGGKPRLETAGFLEAGRWLAGLKQRGGLPAEGDSDATAALNDGRAVLAIASLAEVMKLNPAQKRTGRYGLVALPGTRSFVNPATGLFAPVPLNLVPLLSGGWLGVVRSKCKNPEAAFALVAELTGPARSQEIAAAGFAPVRESHLETDRLLVWLGYGFDEAQTRVLQEAVRTNLGASVRNPVHGLRTPDEAELRKELRAELAAIASGSSTPEAALKRANEKWGRDIHLDWRRRAAGLN